MSTGCVAPAAFLIFEGTFSAFGDSWTYTHATTSVAITLNGTSTRPAKDRGQYLNGVDDYFSFDTTLDIHLNFAIMSWIRLDDVSGIQP